MQWKQAVLSLKKLDMIMFSLPTEDFLNVPENLLQADRISVVWWRTYLVQWWTLQDRSLLVENVHVDWVILSKMTDFSTRYPHRKLLVCMNMSVRASLKSIYVQWVCIHKKGISVTDKLGKFIGYLVYELRLKLGLKF